MRERIRRVLLWLARSIEPSPEPVVFLDAFAAIEEAMVGAGFVIEAELASMSAVEFFSKARAFLDSEAMQDAPGSYRLASMLLGLAEYDSWRARIVRRLRQLAARFE